MDKTKKLEELKDILVNLTYYLESNSDNIKNFVMVNDVFEYTDAMWKVLGNNNTKEERENMH